MATTALQGFREVERAGIEPATSSLQSWLAGRDGRQRTTTNERSHAGLRSFSTWIIAWLHAVVL